MLTSGRCSLLGDVDLFDDDGLGRLVHRAGGHALDGVDDLLARFIGDLAEDGVLAVEPRGLGGGDEELRTVGSASHLLAGVGHGQQVLAVELELRVDLIVDRKSTRLNSSHVAISYAVFFLTKRNYSCC